MTGNRLNNTEHSYDEDPIERAVTSEEAKPGQADLRVGFWQLKWLLVVCGYEAEMKRTVVGPNIGYRIYGQQRAAGYPATRYSIVAGV